MATFEKFIAAVDGSEAAEEAVVVAARLAAQVGAPILLVQQAPSKHQLATAEANLAEAAKRVVADDVEGRVVVADRPADGILEAVADEERPLVCMSTHARSAVGQLLLGSVAVEVVRRSPVPVLLVGPEARIVPGDRYDEVVACVDGSEVAEAALPVVSALADEWGLAVRLVQVTEPGGAAGDGTGGGDDGAYLASLAERIGGGRGVTTEVLVGEPVEALARHAEHRTTSLYAVASEAPRVGARLREGSTMADLVSRICCPVVAVGPACRSAAVSVS